MKFIQDYRQFIEVGCTSCSRKHTVQTANYNVTSEGYLFHSPLHCSCGHVAKTAIKDKNTWTIKPEQNEMLKKNKGTTIKIMLVIGFTVIFFASETIYMLNTKDAEQKSAQHDAENEASSTYINEVNYNY